MPFEVSNERSIMLAHNSHQVPVSLVALMRHNYSGTQGTNTLLVAYVKAGLFPVQKLQQCQCISCLVYLCNSWPLTSAIVASVSLQ